MTADSSGQQPAEHFRLADRECADKRDVRPPDVILQVAIPISAADTGMAQGDDAGRAQLCAPSLNMATEPLGVDCGSVKIGSALARASPFDFREKGVALSTLRAIASDMLPDRGAYTYLEIEALPRREGVWHALDGEAF